MMPEQHKEQHKDDEDEEEDLKDEAPVVEGGVAVACLDYKDQTRPFHCRNIHDRAVVLFTDPMSLLPLDSVNNSRAASSQEQLIIITSTQSSSTIEDGSAILPWSVELEDDMEASGTEISWRQHNILRRNNNINATGNTLSERHWVSSILLPPQRLKGKSPSRCPLFCLTASVFCTLAAIVGLVMLFIFLLSRGVPAEEATPPVSVFQRLQPEGAVSSEYLWGASVAVNNDIAVVGSPSAKNTTFGAVHVFRQNDDDENAWTQEGVLLPPPSGSETATEQQPASFGQSVAVHDHRIVVGAECMVFVYTRRQQQAWVHEQALLLPDCQGGGRLMVTAHHDMILATTLSATHMFVFDKSNEKDGGTAWTHAQQLLGGTSLSLNQAGTLLVVGSSQSNLGTSDGAHIFERWRTSGLWVETTGEPLAPGESIRHVAISDDTILVVPQEQQEEDAGVIRVRTFRTKGVNIWDEEESIDVVTGESFASGANLCGGCHAHDFNSAPRIYGEKFAMVVSGRLLLYIRNNEGAWQERAIESSSAALWAHVSLDFEDETIVLGSPDPQGGGVAYTYRLD